MQYPPLLSNCEKYAIMSAGENIWRQGGIKGIMAKIATREIQWSKGCIP